VDRVGEWRLIDSDEPEEASEPPSSANEAEPSGIDKRLLAIVAGFVLAAAGAAIWLTLPQPRVELEVAGVVAVPSVTIDQQPHTTAAVLTEILVDVQGAVAQPGLHRLPAGSRVGDAIAAAGGYGPSVDISAAANQLNLAAHLDDGAKVNVPALGDAPVDIDEPVASSVEPTTGGGPINVNTATADELDTLPGIGPVTADKIIAARTQAPFATVDELLSRQVVGPSTMEKIRELISVD
jgi:competence protein ComEA